MLKLRHEHDAPADHYQVYSGEVRIGTIYKTSGNPSGNEWFWGLNGVQNGPGPFNGFVPTLKDAKAAFSEAWRGRLEANNGFFARDSQDDSLAPPGRLRLPDGNGRPERERAKPRRTVQISLRFRPILATQWYGTQRPLFR